MTATTPEDPFEKTFRLVCRLDDADIDYVRDTAEWIRALRRAACVALDPTATADDVTPIVRRHEHARPLAPDATGDRRRSARAAGRRRRSRMKPRRRAASLAAVGASLAGRRGAPPPRSQLFKCVDGGRTVYQQQACPASRRAEARPRRRAAQRPTGRVAGARAAQAQAAFAPCFIRARHAPMRTSTPGIRIAPQMILSRFSLTHGMLPNR